MTYDLLNTFKKYFEDDKVVVDTYELAEGYYYVFDDSNKFEKLQVSKNGEIDNYELEKYIKIRDFYSRYMDSNKALDTNYKEEIGKNIYSMMKKICSNNIYTLFFKNKSVLGLCNKDSQKDAVPLEVFQNGIKKYYQSLMNLGNSKKEEILVKEKYKQEEINKNTERMIKLFRKVYEDLKDEDMPKETWIKIFMKKDIEEYIRVANIYINVKLFNTNDSNVEFNNIVYGANNYNYGLNSKKTYLELKATPYKIGSYISIDNIKILNKMYIWLYNNSSNKNILKLPLDWNFYGTPKDEETILNKNTYLLKVIGNNGRASIVDYRYISNYNTKIREFTCKDFLGKEQAIVFNTENIYELNWYTNNIWFAENEKSTRNYIRDSYYDYDLKVSKSMLSNCKKEILREYKDLFIELFEQEDEFNFMNKIDKMAIEIVENMYIDNLKQNKKYTYNPRKAFNLWIAYKEYFNKEGVDEGMKINNLQEQCQKIVKEEGKIETDEQYYFLAGQVAYYLLNQSKAEKLTQDVTEPFVKANTVKKLKLELEFLYQKYSYDIYLKFPKFNNILSQLLLQEPEGKIKDNKDILLAGLLSSNLFYEKQEKLNNGGNENE